MQVTAPSKYSLRAFAYEMLNTYYSFGATDDKKLSIRQMEVNCKREASTVIWELARADLLLGFKPDESLYTTFRCLEIEDDCDEVCECDDESVGIKSVKIPDLLYVNGKPQISYFGSQWMDVPFTRASSVAQAIKLAKGTIGLKRTPFYVIAGKKAYIILPKGFELLDKITIVGIPQDGDGTDATTCAEIWETEWNVPLRVKSLVQDRILGKLLPQYMAYKPNRDFRNNNNDGNQIASTYKQSNQP